MSLGPRVPCCTSAEAHPKRINKKNKYYAPGSPFHKKFVHNEFVLYGYNKYIDVLRMETAELNGLRQIRLNMIMTGQLMTGGKFFKKVFTRIVDNCNLRRAIEFQTNKVRLIRNLMDQEWTVYDVVQRDLYTYFYGHVRYEYGRHYCVHPSVRADTSITTIITDQTPPQHTELLPP